MKKFTRKNSPGVRLLGLVPPWTVTAAVERARLRYYRRKGKQ